MNEQLITLRDRIIVARERRMELHNEMERINAEIREIEQAMVPLCTKRKAGDIVPYRTAEGVRGDIKVARIDIEVRADRAIGVEFYGPFRKKDGTFGTRCLSVRTILHPEVE